MRCTYQVLCAPVVDGLLASALSRSDHHDRRCCLSAVVKPFRCGLRTKSVGMAGSSLVGLPANGCNKLSAVDLCNASGTAASGMGVRVLCWQGRV